MGYEPVFIACSPFRRKNFNQSAEIIYPMAYEAVLLAAPPERLASFIARLEGEEVIVCPVKTSFDLRCALWKLPRWSMPEWTELSRPELVALLGRQYSKQELIAFLDDTQ